MKISYLKEKLIFTLLYIGCVAVLAYLEVPCILRYFLGIICPGCGMTRAVTAAVRLDINAAFGYHPMFWSLPILYVYFLIDGGLFKQRLWNALLVGGIGVGFLANWIIKIVGYC